MSFHVPEGARVTSGNGWSGAADGNNGCFDLASNEPGWRLFIIAADGLGWEHVSVHAYKFAGQNRLTRTPGWREMCFLKDLFWDPEDVAMQLHPRKSEYVNVHPHCLHLWRPGPFTAAIPTPPKVLVG